MVDSAFSKIGIPPAFQAGCADANQASSLEKVEVIPQQRYLFLEFRIASRKSTVESFLQVYVYGPTPP